LADRASESGIETLVVSASRGDLNTDLRQCGVRALRAAIRTQLVPEDVDRFMQL